MGTLRRLAWIGKTYVHTPGVLTYTGAAMQERSKPDGAKHVLDVEFLAEKDKRNRRSIAKDMKNDVNSELDRYLPWVAKRLSDRLKELRSVDEDKHFLLSMDIHNVRAFLRPISEWASARHVDLMPYSIHAAITAQHAWHEALAIMADRKPAVPGKTVYTWSDGWTLQDLGYGTNKQIKRRLNSEAKAMGHCVSGKRYFMNVVHATMRILSLRDTLEMPYLTIEIDVATGKIMQFKGIANALPPDPAICKRMRPWLEATLDRSQWGEAAMCWPKETFDAP